MPVTRLSPTITKTTPAELATQQLMRPGVPVPGMRRSTIAIASTNTAAETQLLAAPTGNIKYLVKSLVITNPTAGTINVTVAGQSSGAWGLFNGLSIAAQSSVSIPMSLVLNAGAAVGLFAAASAVGLVATVNYAALDTAELPTQLCLAYGTQGAAARVDIYQTPTPFVITWLMFGATSSGGATQPIFYGMQGTHVADLIVPVNGLVVVDDPLYLNPNDYLSAQNFGATGNWVSVTACGYPALT